MKLLKSTLLACLLMCCISCAKEENEVVFYIENYIEESLILDDVASLNSDIQSQYYTSLNLWESSSFRKYSKRLSEIEINRFVIHVEGPSNTISNAHLELNYNENYTLPTIHTTGSYEVYDIGLLNHLTSLFSDQNEVLVGFNFGAIDSNSFTIRIEVEVTGTFVY